MPKNPETGSDPGINGRVPLGFGNLYASVGDHFGHFYQSEEAWKNILVPFLKAGLEAGDKCVYVIEPGSGRQGILEALATDGIDVASATDSRQLVLEEGRSHPAELQEMLRATLAEIPEKFPLLRWGGEMTWSLEKIPKTETLMEWETHCNVVENPSAVFLCQYDVTRFLGNVIMDALSTHPLCIVSNAIHHNPYYREPEAFLEELRSRDSATPAH